MFQEFQIKIIKAIQSLSNPFFDELFNIISFFGESIIVIILIAYLYWIYDKKYGEKIITVMVTSMVFNNAIKGVVKANRPFMDDNTVINKRPDTATGYSFPSGHSQTAGTLYTSLMLKFKNNWMKILMPILIILIMFSRMYLGAHYPIDVIVGGLLGVFFAIFLPFIINKTSDLKLMLAIEIVLFIPFMILYYIRQEELNYDFFKMYGLLIGFFLAYIYEHRFVNFSNDVSKGKKVLRLLLGLLLLAGIQGGLKALFGIMFPNANFALTASLHVIRYCLLTFVGLGLYPHLFKKLNF